MISTCRVPLSPEIRKMIGCTAGCFRKSAGGERTGGAQGNKTQARQHGYSIAAKAAWQVMYVK